ncbi:hypothetical protein [Labrenzia sp. VG12]|uniref:hypothetical protein n=1 Tax=Labrenzia sp. VG12 TaxID=2021862 RepID=UPI000B8C309A|nr:hypothetical protein [Labrenzia sp. VG12]ASP36375.1 hypothetical protein CHH27_26605 [Labrenzia sp. VG12]
MTGLRSRHPVKKPDYRDRDNQTRSGWSPTALFQPGFANICLCHVLVAAVLTVPFAFFMAIRHAETGEKPIEAHYLYVRTTIALLVIGTGIGSFLILLGAPLSSSLMLSGLALIAATLLLTLPRCCYGLSCAARRKPLRNPKSFLI